MSAARASQAKAPAAVKAARKNTLAAPTIVPLSSLAPPQGACACGGECPRCRATGLQAKLAITTPGDRYEREADRVADHVMRLPDPASVHETPRASASAAFEAPRPPASTPTPTLSRASCAACERGVEHADAIPTSVSEALHTSGHSLDTPTRTFMEPRFGHDFSDVRVHADTGAAASARAVNALAYTVGRDVVFAAGQYTPSTDSGRKLLAHELAHVVQQRAGGAPPQLARTVSPGTFNCPANTHGAPADPFADLDAIDRDAQGLVEASSNLAIIASILDPSTNTTGTAQAYRTRFGNPTPQGANFVNRFTGATLATQEQASQEEIMEIGDRLDRIRTFIGGPIRYTCRRPNVQFQHSNCVSTCGANDVAFTCAPQDLRRIEICPRFWGLGADQQAISIIHEAVHMLLNFKQHGSASRGARGRNPECYASFVADIFNITPFDGRCPPLP